MKTLKRSMGWVMLVAFSLVLIVGPSIHAQEKVQITFYHRSHQAELDWAGIIIDRFHEEYPHIEVSLVPSGTGGGIDYSERIVVMQAGGLAPDVFTGYADKAGFIANQMTLDLAPFVERDYAELEVDTFFPTVWETFIRNGKQFGIPLTITPQFIFYNVDMFGENGLPDLPISWEDPSWTWDDLVTFSRVLTRKEGGNYSQLGLSQASEMKLPDISWMFGGDWFTEEAYETGIAERVTLNTPENIRAYSELQMLYQDYAALGPAKGITHTTGFQEGRVGMDWIGAWRLNFYRDAIDAGGMPFAWRIAPIPLAENRENTRWTNPLYISSASKHPDEAWEFVKFATSTASQQLWAEMTSLMPARASAIDEYIESLAVLSNMSERDLLEVINGAIMHSRPSIEELIADVPFEISQRASRMFGPIFRNEVGVTNSLIQAEEELNGYIRGLGLRWPW